MIYTPPTRPQGPLKSRKEVAKLLGDIKESLIRCAPSGSQKLVLHRGTYWICREERAKEGWWILPLT